jgi:hypothetical protein
MKKYSAFLAIKEMQIKATLRFQLEWPYSRTQTTTNAGEDAVK